MPPLDLLQGTLDMLILQTLQWGPQHGYAIGQTIRARSSETLKVETGSLYPALHRLEKQGWVKAEWDVTDANQRAKFYRLTPAGKKQLLQERDRWAQIVAAIASAVIAAPQHLGRREVIRDVTARLRRYLAFVDIRALDDEQVHHMCSALCDETFENVRSRSILVNKDLL